MKQWYAAHELAGLPGLPASAQNVTRKATAEGWKSQPRLGRGGGREYAYISLPRQTQTAMIERDQHSLPIALPRIDAARLGRVQAHIKTTIEQRTDAWLFVLKAYEAWENDACSTSKLERDLAFVQAYQQQQVELPLWVYLYLPKLSRTSLKDKQKLRRAAPKLIALGGNYGHRWGRGRIDADPELQADIKSCLAAGGKHWGAPQIYDILQLEFGLDAADCSIGQLRTWIRRFRRTHPQEWALYMSPDRAKGLVSPAFGSRSQNILRPNHVWEIDTMRVDMNCRIERADSDRLVRVFVVACLDIFTRRVLLHVSEQTDAEAVCLTIAAAVLKWGVPEHIRTDHGKEYLSQRVQRFLATLDVETEDLRCLPGHPEQKPFVERFNRTFQHRDLVKSPFFLGHNVGDRQALRNSPSREPPGIKLAMSIDQFQRWCDLWCVEYEQRPHGRAGIGLEGKSPLEMLAGAIQGGWTNRIIQNPRELDFLMMAAPGKQGMRKVGRQGISVGGRLYVAAELSTWIGRSVYACFDPRNPRKVYIYRSAELTAFVCEAEWRQAEGVDLAAIANQARHLYEVLLRSINQIHKRGKVLLRKLASDPHLLVGQTAESLEQVIQSQIHLYPAIKAVTAAITASESEDETVTIDLELYHQELQRLEAESQQQSIQQEQQRSRQQQLEELVDRWQRQQSCPALEPSERDTISRYLTSPEGRGFLMAVTASTPEEQQFWQWFTGQTVESVAIVNYRSFLETAIARWQTQQAVSLEDKQLLLHYIGEPEGFGVLRAYLDDAEEHEFQLWLKQDA